jgi:hypothetical protein
MWLVVFGGNLIRYWYGKKLSRNDELHLSDG